MAKLILQISKGLIRGQHTRRMIMFYAVLADLVMLFLGAVVFDGWLRDRPLLFLIYWGACAWITLLAVLLAIFDMLLVRAALHAERRRLAEQISTDRFQREDDENAA